MATVSTLRVDSDRLLYAAMAAIGAGVVPIVTLSASPRFDETAIARLALCFVLTGTAIAAFLLLRGGFRRTAATVLVSVLWTSATTFIFATGIGLHSSVVFLYIPTILFTALLCGLRAATLVTALTLAALAVLCWAEDSGRISGLLAFAQKTTHFNFTLGVAVACIASLIIAVAYERAVRQAVSALNFSRKELAAAHGALLDSNRSLELRVAERTRELEEKVDEVECYSDSVAHDLRTPLRSINAFATRVRRSQAERLDDEGRRMLERLAAESLRMDALLIALLDLGRLGSCPLAEARIDLSALAQEVADRLAQDQAAEKTLFRIEPGLVADGDPVLLRTLIEELFGNAAKFSRGRAAPEVALGCTSTGTEDVFFVQDNGAGFDQEHTRQLFRPFFRLHRSDEFEGLGIGLAKVRRIVRRHGGRVWAAGMPRIGATFYFTLRGSRPAGNPE